MTDAAKKEVTTEKSVQLKEKVKKEVAVKPEKKEAKPEKKAWTPDKNEAKHEAGAKAGLLERDGTLPLYLLSSSGTAQRQ